MSEFEHPSSEDYQTLRRPIDPNIRHQIDEVVLNNPDIGPDKLAEIFGRDDVERYFTNPDAEGFGDA